MSFIFKTLGNIYLFNKSHQFTFGQYVKKNNIPVVKTYSAQFNSLV